MCLNGGGTSHTDYAATEVHNYFPPFHIFLYELFQFDCRKEEKVNVLRQKQLFQDADVQCRCS